MFDPAPAFNTQRTVSYIANYNMTLVWALVIVVIVVVNVVVVVVVKGLFAGVRLQKRNEVWPTQNGVQVNIIKNLITWKQYLIWLKQINYDYM